PAMQFDQNPDILATVARLERRPFCVGFAAESENLLQYGEEKRKKKNIPLLVGNIGPQTFGKDDNELVLFDERGHTRLPRADKQQLARSLVAEIAARL
ncbi:phosphopantothenate synthase, partial [Oxalobacteraceae bacterium OM1]